MNDQHRAAPPSTRMARTQLAAAISAILAVGAQFHALPAAADEIEEIVVTATRRAQSLSDIPYNISARKLRHRWYPPTSMRRRCSPTSK